jgi:hypothetical protein
MVEYGSECREYLIELRRRTSIPTCTNRAVRVVVAAFSADQCPHLNPSPP